MPEVAHFMLERLREWGVHRVYGYPGDGINAILGAFDKVGDDPSGPRGTGRSPRIGRLCSSSSPIRGCRRCHPT